MTYKVIYDKNTSFCDLAKMFNTTPYAILKRNNISNILDLVEGMELEIKEGEHGNGYN